MVPVEPVELDDGVAGQWKAFCPLLDMATDGANEDDALEKLLSMIDQIVLH